MSMQRRPDGTEEPTKANPSNAKPVEFAGQTFRTQGRFIAHLAGELGLTRNQVQGRLYALNWDIDAAIAALRQQAATAAKAPPAARALPPPTIKPPKQSNHGNSISCRYNGRLFPSKSALASELAARSGVDCLSLLFEPAGDLGPRLDYFITRFRRCPPLVGDDRLPLAYRGQLFFSAGKLARAIAAELSISQVHAQAIILGLGHDVSAEVANYCWHFGIAFVEPKPAMPPAEDESRAINSSKVEKLEQAVAAPADRSGLPPLPREVSEQLERIRLAFDEQAAQIADLHQQLAAAQHAVVPNGNDSAVVRQLENLSVRLRQLEHSSSETRRQVAATTDQFTVILQKVGQIAHDLRLRSPDGGMRVPRPTRRDPLGEAQ